MNTLTEMELQPRMARASSLDEDPAKDSRPLGEIANDIWQKAETLIRQEMNLGITDAQERLEIMRGEVEEQVDHLKLEIAAKAAGGAVVFVGVLALASALILGLSDAMPAWAAALIVGVLFVAGGALLLRWRLSAAPPVKTRELLPRRALESTKKDIQSIEEAIK